MTQLESQLDQAPPARHRRTVRIVKLRTTSRTAVVSLVVATVAALSFTVVWHLRQTEQVLRPPPRTLSQVELEWKCEAGHTFSAAGQIEPRLCLTCDRAAYPVTQYRCPNPKHGPYEVAVRFVEDGNGGAKKSQLRLMGREWVPAEKGVRCPLCNRRLEYRGKDPLEDVRRRQRTGGS